MGMPYTVLMPVIAAQVLHGGPHTLGFLMGAMGIGALAGAVYLASRASVVGLGRVISAAAILFGSGLIAFSLSRHIVLSLVLMVVTGVGFMVQLASSNTVIQTIVREEMRGRVMAFYTMAFMGTAPFGSLMAGVLATRIGAPNTILLGGVVCIAGGLAFRRQLPRLREMVVPIYVERGILPRSRTAWRTRPRSATSPSGEIASFPELPDGNVRLTTSPPWRSPMSVLTDLRFALRLWRRHPTMVAVAGISLGLGVGATTTMYSVVNKVAHYKLGFKDVDRLVIVSNTDPEQGNNEQPPTFEIVQALRKDGTSFEDFGGAQFFGAPVTLSGTDETSRVLQMPVDVGGLSVVGVRPSWAARTGRRTSTTSSSRRKRGPSSSRTRRGSAASAARTTSSGRPSTWTASRGR
jgi:MFS family permease